MIKRLFFIIFIIVIGGYALKVKAIEQGGDCFWSDRGDTTCQKTFRDGSFVVEQNNEKCSSQSRSEGVTVCCCPKPQATAGPRYIIIGILALLIGGAATAIVIYRKNELE